MKSTPFQIIVIAVFSVIIAVTFLVLFLSKGNSGGSRQNKVDLSLWGTVPSAYVQAVLGATEADKSGLNVTYKQIDPGSFDGAFIEALASGRGPDAIIIPQDSIISYQDKLYLIPYATISERNFKDTYVGEAELFLSKNGVVGIPFAIDPLVTYWNRDLFSSAGISKPPQYWDEFLRLAESLTKRNDSGSIRRSAVALGESSNITNAKEIISAMALQAGVPITTRSQSDDSVKNTFTSASGTGLQNVVDFYVEFANPVKSVYTWSRALPSSQSMFTQGDLAVYLGFAGELPVIQSKNPNLDFDFTYFPQPRDANNKITFGKVYAVSIVRWSPKAALAIQLAALFGSQAGVKAWSDASGLPPVRRDLLSQKPGNPYAAISYDSALWSRGWLDPNSARTKEIFRNMVENVTSGWMTTAQSVGKASSEMGNLLEGQ